MIKMTIEVMQLHHNMLTQEWYMPYIFKR